MSLSLFYCLQFSVSSPATLIPISPFVTAPFFLEFPANFPWSAARLLFWVNFSFHRNCFQFLGRQLFRFLKRPWRKGTIQWKSQLRFNTLHNSWHDSMEVMYWQLGAHFYVFLATYEFQPIKRMFWNRQESDLSFTSCYLYPYYPYPFSSPTLLCAI